MASRGRISDLLSRNVRRSPVRRTDCLSAAARAFASCSMQQARQQPQQPRFSPGSEPGALQSALAPLLSTSGGRWTLAADGEALERTFRFKTFAKTWDFMTAVSLQCKLKNHHPEWSNVFSTTFIRWTTHSPKGLSAKDVDMAGICDSLAKDYGEVQDPNPDGGLRSLADKAVASSGDCCTPKGK